MHDNKTQIKINKMRNAKKNKKNLKINKKF